MATDAKAAQEDAPQLTNEELEKKINALDTRLSKAIADVRKDLTEEVGELSTAVTKAANEMKQISAKAKGNETRLGALESTASTLTTTVGKFDSAIKTIATRLDGLEQFQGELNTAFVKGIQDAKDFALEQGNAAKGHADQKVDALDKKVDGVKSTLEGRIKAVEDAPVKQHTHKLHITLDGQTGGPDGGNG